MCYKTFVFIALLFLSIGLFSAQDNLITLFPANSTKVSDKFYKLSKDFDSSVKKVKLSLEQSENIRSESLIKENGFRIYVFYNLRTTAEWTKLFIIEEDGKVTARFY